MTDPSGLDPQAAARIARQFGVAFEQVRRDHLISLTLAALTPLSDQLVFFGGTALATTTKLPPMNLSATVSGAPSTRSQPASDSPGRGLHAAPDRPTPTPPAVARIENLSYGCMGGQSVSVGSDDNPWQRQDGRKRQHDLHDLTALVVRPAQVRPAA